VIPRLPRGAWVVLAGDALSAIGGGMTLPFLLVYLHAVRGLSLTLAGLAVATVAVSSLVGNPLGGVLTDRFSARSVLVGGLVLGAIGATLLLFVRAPWQAFAATSTIGLGASIAWPAQDALLASLAGPDWRSDVFCVRHATLNAGLGIGALIAAAIVDSSAPQTFTILYLADAVTFVAFAAILLVLRSPFSDCRSGSDTSTGSGLGVVLRDRVFVRVWALCAFVVAISYGQLHAAFPAYATRSGGISASALSLAYCANALTVLAVQLVVLRLLRGHRRTTAIALACGALAVAWQITIVAGQLGSGIGAEITFSGALAVFALAEALLAASFAPLINDIAPERLRGRYNGLSALAWTTGFLLGPAIAGVALDSGIENGLFVGLMVASGCAAMGAWHLARHLHPDTNVVQIS
jgi:MFS family permease